MHAGLLDVFHDPADHEAALVVAQGVDIDLRSVLEEAVHQDRTLGGQPALAAE